MSPHNDSRDEDGFVTLHVRKRRGEGMDSVVRFYSNQAVLRVARDWPERATWQWDGSDTLRLRFHEDGELMATAKGQRRCITTGPLVRGLGRVLHGALPITDVVGHDIYLSITEQTDGAA